MPVEIIVAIIGLVTAIITSGFAVLNGWVQKRLTEVSKKQKNTDILEIQNNILEQLIPVLEKKDLAMDRIADILEEQSKRLSYIEAENREFSSRLDNRCEAPKLLSEFKRLEEDNIMKGVREEIIKDLENE